MNPTRLKFVSLCVLTGLLTGKASAFDGDLARFAAAKEAEARQSANAQTNKVPSIVWSFFDAVRVDDWRTATNLADRIEKASGRYVLTNKEPVSPALQTAIWPSISETIGAYEQFHNWDNKWLHRFGSGIIDSIPKGSIYFGGTDPGRFIISALSESQREARPFFILTQNQLADGTYLEYLQKVYGGKIYIPTAADSRKAFEEYLADAQQRLKAGKLKPGENVQFVKGRVQVSGQVAVMEINGLLVKIILQKNLNREFYIEESFPLDWMYSYLSPHGLILELHHEPIAQLRAETMQKDQEYWKEFVGELIGDWITDKTSVKEICDFNEKIYLQKNLDGFKGDSAFAKNDEAQKCFSKLRSAIAGLYVWRTEHAKEEDEKNRMSKAADLASRQALALCPSSPEAVFRYSKFLSDLKRPDEAMLIAKTSLRIAPTNSYFLDLVRSLRKAE